MIILSYDLVLKLYGSQVELPTVPLSLALYDLFVYWIFVCIKKGRMSFY